MLGQRFPKTDVSRVFQIVYCVTNWAIELSPGAYSFVVRGGCLTSLTYTIGLADLSANFTYWRVDYFCLLLAFFAPANSHHLTSSASWRKNKVDKTPKNSIKLIFQMVIIDRQCQLTCRLVVCQIRVTLMFAAMLTYKTSPATDVTKINPAGPNRMIRSEGNINRTMGNNIFTGAL